MPICMHRETRSTKYVASSHWQTPTAMKNRVNFKNDKEHHFVHDSGAYLKYNNRILLEGPFSHL